jgi:hypothetical protein
MLFLNKTRVVASKPMKVASGVTIADEGQALVVVNEGGQAVVKPSTGAPGEVFAGVAAFERRTPTTLAAVKRYAGTGAVQTINIANYVDGSAYITIDGADLNATTPQATITSAGVLTITAAVASTSVIEIAYTYQPTVIQAQRLVGTNFPFTAVAAGAQVGTIYTGEVYVSNFDTSVHWVGGGNVNLGANGTFTNTGADNLIAKAFVCHAPTESEPYLGIDLR